MSTLEVIREGHDEYAAKGRGLLMHMESFKTFFSLKLAHLVFSAAEQFSTNLQAKNTTVAEGIRGARLLISHYTSLRSEATFIDFYQDALKSSRSLTEEPVLTRPRKIPRKYDTGAQPHHYTSPEEMYRQAYFEALDHVGGEIEKRFDQSDLASVCEVESLLLEAANGQNISEIPETVTMYFREKIDLALLKVQLPLYSNDIASLAPGQWLSDNVCIQNSTQNCNNYYPFIYDNIYYMKVFVIFPRLLTHFSM